jgi:hypothetical protein
MIQLLLNPLVELRLTKTRLKRSGRGQKEEQEL